MITPTDGATISGRRIDITPGEAVSVRFNVASTDLNMWFIHSITSTGIDANGVTVTNTSTPENGMYSATLSVPASGVTSGTYTMHFSVVYDELDSEGNLMMRYTREEQYTVVIEESFYVGLYSDIPDTLAAFATDDNRGALSVGREFTLMNNNSVASGIDEDIVLAIPTPPYQRSTFEITTQGYPIELTEVSTIGTYQVLTAGELEPQTNITFRIARI